ncbi:MAG: purine-cytosine permease family protein [Tepidanaerobacteraceae bacterium]|jgi:cytosine permease
MDNNTNLAAQNDYALSRVPASGRKSIFNVSLVAIGFCISMAGLFTGAALAAGLNLREAIIASLIGNAILTVYGGLVGVAGAREGVSTAMLARHSFGRKGSMVISVIIAVTLVGWYAYQVGFFGMTINTMFPNGGFITSVKFASLWGGLLMMTSAYIGYRGLSIISNIAAPAILITSLMGIIKAVNLTGGWDALFALRPEGTMSYGAAAVLIVGAFAVGGAIQADITRYSKNAGQSLIATAIGYMIAHSFVIVAGYLTCLTTGTGDLPAAMIQLGLGIPALIVLIAAQWTTNDNNLYSSSLAFSNVVKVKKSKIVLVCGIIATIAGVFGLADYFVNWLTILGVGVPPVAGIIIADYFVINKSKYSFDKDTEYGDISRPAFIAWIIASIIGFSVKWGIQCINSLVAGFVLYLVLVYIFKAMNINMFGQTVKDVNIEADFK